MHICLVTQKEHLNVVYIGPQRSVQGRGVGDRQLQSNELHALIQGVCFLGGLLCRSIAQFLREDAILKIPVMPIYGAIPRNMFYTVHLYYANSYTYSLFIHIYQIPTFFYYLHRTIPTHISQPPNLPCTDTKKNSKTQGNCKPVLLVKTYQRPELTYLVRN